jgi:D-glycero-alpha-D-manno-heptose-7-phosphate kinase
VSNVPLPEALWWELESRLSLIFLGKPHRSSEMHDRLLRDLEDAGPECPKIDALRHPPLAGKNALCAGDFEAFGVAMRENTEMQAALHASLVPERARQIFEVAEKHGALGWKVNGAGGEGGSVTILSGSSRSRHRVMLHEIEDISDDVSHIPIHLSRRGLRVWETT